MSKLNINLLRWKSRIEKVIAQQKIFFSRRQFLGGAAAILGRSSQQRSGARQIEFRYQDDKAAFSLDGVERWVFDVQAFSAGAQLRVLKNTDGEIVLTFREVRYPGTVVPMNLDVHALRHEGIWDCMLALPDQGVTRRVDLIRWLEGEPIDWQRSVPEVFLPASSPVRLSVTGDRRMSLDCGWRIKATGNFSLVLEGCKKRLSAGALHVIPAGYSGDMSLAFHDGPATRLNVESGRQGWDASVAPLLRSAVIEIAEDVPVFDSLQIDSWEPVESGPRAALRFGNSSGQSVQGFLHGEMRMADDTRVSLPLVRPAYSLAADGERREYAFFASLARPVTAYSSSHAIVFEGQVAVQHAPGQAGSSGATIGATSLYLNHYEQPDGTLFQFVIPPGYELPALHLGHHLGPIERGWDAIVEFFISAFTSDKFEAPLDGVTVRMIRPKDTLNLEFSFEGLKLKMHAGRPYLKREKLPGGGLANAYLTVKFPPQSLQENAFFEDDLGQGTPSAPVATSSSGPTLLRFQLDSSVFEDELPFAVETLLDWKRYTFVPGDRRRPDAGSRIEVPYRLYLNPPLGVRFQHDVSPRTSVEVTTAALEKVHQQRAPELWGTLLHNAGNPTEQGFDLASMAMRACDAADIAELMTVQASGPNTVRATLRRPLPLAVGASVTLFRGAPSTPWAAFPDPAISIQRVFTANDGSPAIEYTFQGAHFSTLNAPPVAPDPPLWLVPLPKGSLDQIGGVATPPMSTTDRGQIVVITTAGKDTPLTVNQLTLTALGAWFDTDSKFDDDSLVALDANLDLVKWRHIMVLGRDSFVQIEHKGFLWPYGHKAVYIVRTERVFFSVLPIDPNCDKTKLFCYLRQQSFVRVREKSKTYYDDSADPRSATWDLPFTEVDIDTPITPALAKPSNLNWFVPQINVPGPNPGQPGSVIDFQFALTGHDWAKPSASIPFSNALVFVSSMTNVNAGELSQARMAYANGIRNVVQLNEQHVHFADSQKPGDTEQQVQSLTLTGTVFMPLNTVGKLVNFYPAMISASVLIPPIQKLTGVAQQSTVAYEQNVYKPYGFTSDSRAGNPAEIYLTINDGTTSLQFPGPHSGGVVRPTIPLNSITRPKGAISFNLQDTLAPTAAAFFPPVSPDIFPKLFGVIPLQDLLFGVGDINPSPFSMNDVPTTLTNLVDGAMALCQQIQSYSSVASQVFQFANLVQNVRSGATARLVAVYRQQAQAALQNAIGQQIATVNGQLTGALTAAETDLVNTAGNVAGFNIAMVRATCDSLQQNLEGTVAAFAGNVAAQLDSAASMSIEAVFQAEQTLDTINTILTNISDNADQVVSQVQSLQNIASIFSVLQTQTAASVTTTLLTQFLTQQLQNEVAENSSLAVQFAANLNAPLTQFERNFGEAADAAATLFSYTWDQAVASLLNPTSQALGMLAQAKATYTKALTQSAGAVNSAVAAAQQAVVSAVTNTITNGVTAIVNAVLADPGLQQQIAASLAAVGAVLQALLDLIAFVGRLQTILTTPVSYGMHYDLPEIPLKSSLIFVNHMVDADGPTATLNIEVQISASETPVAILAGNKPTIDYQVTASIANFGIGLFSGETGSFITINCQALTVTVKNQDHPQVHFQLGSPPMQFGEDMQYVAGLIQSFASLGSGNSGPLIEASGSGIDLGWGFGIPDIEAGGFRMTGVAFSFAVHLPLGDGDNDAMKLRFYFARPEKHFTISAGIYGGGGYVMLEGGPSLSHPGDGASAAIDAFGVCLEFGATTALDLVLASGEAHIMAGTYIGTDNKVFTLTGFVRAGGSLNVIGILTMSLEIYIGISYAGDGVINGTGSVSVSISIAFFSVDVTVTMSWTWNQGGGGARAVTPADNARTSSQAIAAAAPPETPVRMQYLSRDQWNTYAHAF